MVAVSLMIEGQHGLTWSHWKQLAGEVEELGFAGLFRSDHFTDAQPPDSASLEMIVSLTYLADHTQHVHFGPLVAPLSMRNPRSANTTYLALSWAIPLHVWHALPKDLR